jgi:hypothetical protein
MGNLNTLVHRLQAERMLLSAQLENINNALAALKVRGCSTAKTSVVSGRDCPYPGRAEEALGRLEKKENMKSSAMCVEL